MRFKWKTAIGLLLILLVFIIYTPDYVRSAEDKPGTIKWTFEVGCSLPSPVIGEDGTIYVTNMYKKTLYAVNPDGSEKWRIQVGGLAYHPAVGEDGTIYMGSGDNKLYAINPDGTLRWSRFAVREIENASPTIGKDGVVYIRDEPGGLYAINPDGTQKWRIKIGKEKSSLGYMSRALIIREDTIYIKDYGNVFAVNLEGNEKWSLGIDKRPISGPVIGEDGALYLGMGEMENFIYVIDSNDGSKKREIPVAGTAFTDPIIDHNGVIYIGIFGNEYLEHERLFAQGDSGGLADAPWPKFRFDNKNSGRYQGSRPQDNKKALDFL